MRSARRRHRPRRGHRRPFDAHFIGSTREQATPASAAAIGTDGIALTPAASKRGEAQGSRIDGFFDRHVHRSECGPPGSPASSPLGTPSDTEGRLREMIT
jgi:hypothetical protein